MAEDSKENIIMENHEFGMPPAHYADWPVLNDTFTILSTTRDRRAAAALRSPLLAEPLVAACLRVYNSCV